MEQRLRKLGIEKKLDLDANFDIVYDKYKKKAEDEGYFGELKFVKEHANVIVYVVITN
jgi:hypothetical protein